MQVSINSLQINYFIYCSNSLLSQSFSESILQPSPNVQSVRKEKSLFSRNCSKQKETMANILTGFLVMCIIQVILFPATCVCITNDFILDEMLSSSFSKQRNLYCLDFDIYLLLHPSVFSLSIDTIYLLFGLQYRVHCMILLPDTFCYAPDFSTSILDMTFSSSNLFQGLAAFFLIFFFTFI